MGPHRLPNIFEERALMSIEKGRRAEREEAVHAYEAECCRLRTIPTGCKSAHDSQSPAVPSTTLTRSAVFVTK